MVVGKVGIEPTRFSATELKSVVATSYTTRPTSVTEVTD